MPENYTVHADSGMDEAVGEMSDVGETVGAMAAAAFYG